MTVVVMGAGVVGSTTAYMLTRAGLDVTVIDRQDRPGMETSFANGGLMNPSDSGPWNSPGTVKNLGNMLFDDYSPLKIRPSAIPSMIGWGLRFLANSTPRMHKANMIANIRLAQLSLETLRAIRAEEGLTYDQTVRGTMRMFPPDGRMSEFVQMCREMEEWGVVFDTLDKGQILEKEPCVAPVIDRYIGAVLFPDDESGDAHKFTNEIARVAQASGATFLMGTEVIDIVRESATKISHIHTTKGEIQANAFVLSLGSYSPKFSSRLGIHLPIIPVKGHSITVPLNGWQGGPTRPILDDGLHAMITPMGDRLRMGGRAEFAGYNTAVDIKEGLRVLNNGFKMLPELKNHMNADSGLNWSGLRAMTPGGPPVIGPTRYSNLFLNTGHGPLGWTMACGSARITTDYITQGHVTTEAVAPEYYAL
ncbi:FAD-dependent oxidoreductase [Mesorhizobium silamurunense]|uniref:FAD-dependent oxidoreductase n=1 Tax=Mesorhizobium silamurunense TaxID=499528 RepID=UPI001784F73B|nr:FAD-dependent oxidoreductase [Mesorhizobium silamurunense]